MTFASKITLTRLLLVPVFAVFAIYYGNSIEAGGPVEWFRWTALAIFVMARRHELKVTFAPTGSKIITDRQAKLPR